MTLLWDELWAGALTQHQPEASRRLSALAAELNKVADRETLSEQERTAIAQEKYGIAVKPVSGGGGEGEIRRLDFGSLE